MNKQKAPEKKPETNQAEFDQFTLLTKNLLSVSNKEMRDKMEENQRNKKPRKRKSA